MHQKKYKIVFSFENMGFYGRKRTVSSDIRDLEKENRGEAEMKIMSIRFLQKEEKAILPKAVRYLPKRWQRAYIEKRKPCRWEGDMAILQTRVENSRTALWRKQAERLLEEMKKEGVMMVIPPLEGDLPRGILPFAEGRKLTILFAFIGAAEALKRQGKEPAECRYLLAGGNEEMWRSALVSMGNEVNHLAIFTADKKTAEKLEQELFEEWGLMTEVFASAKHPAFGQADVVFCCGMEQRKYEHMLKSDAVWIDLAGNRPVLRKLQESRPDVVACDGFFFGQGKQRKEGRRAEAEAFLSCPSFRENLQGTGGKEVLCELQERGYVVSGFSVLGKQAKIRKKP